MGEEVLLRVKLLLMYLQDKRTGAFTFPLWRQHCKNSKSYKVDHFYNFMSNISHYTIIGRPIKSQSQRKWHVSEMGVKWGFENNFHIRNTLYSLYFT